MSETITNPGSYVISAGPNITFASPSGTPAAISFVASSSGPPPPSADYTFFIEPHLAAIEKCRQYLMSIMNKNTGLIPGGKFPNGTVCGIAPSHNPGAVLADNNLMLGKTLDYLNAQKGVTTNVDATVRGLLHQNWVGIGSCRATVQTYHDNDRHETLFGTKVPNILGGGTQQWVLPGKPDPFTSADGVITALANPPQAHVYTPPSGFVDSLENMCPYMLNLYLSGNQAQALIIYDDVIKTLQATGNTQLGGYAGDSGGAFDVRNTAYTVILARAFGRVKSWNAAEQASITAVMDALVKFQQTDGSFGAPESNAQALLAIGEPRLPKPFGN